MGDFDPFAADYPPATCDSKKTRVKFCTTAGDAHVNVDRALSPEGVDRFLALVEGGHFTDMLLYRVLPGFLVQFGASAASAQWEDKALPDEPNRFTFRGGTLSFAGSGGPNSRTCHLFVALSPKGAELGGAAHEATLGHFEDVGVFETVARNFEALPGLRQEAAEAQARLGRAKASLKKKQAARAATIKGMAARVKPPLETRWVPRFRSPTVDT